MTIRGRGIRRFLAVLAAVAAGAALARPARAQAVAALATTADVNTTALTLINQTPLAFGTVIPGTPTTVNPQTSASAGYFVIQGVRRAEISITMTLPAQLTTGAGGATMPISFGAQGGCFRDRPPQTSCTFYDPSTTLVDRIRNQNPPNNHYHLWVGGTVSPAAAQQGGVYTGTITLTAAYTGN